MGEQRSSKARLITTLVVVILLAVTLVATACLWLLVDRERYGWGLTLTLRILWGVWIVTWLAIILTRVTIFGWSFRRYFRWPEDGPPPQQAPRPTRAPWNKGSKTSFSITVVMVSLTGAAAVATTVMWILEGVTGPWVFSLVFKIIWATWWVGVITTVLIRIAIFGVQRSRGKDPPEPPETEKEHP
jgi:hypothetical protein